MACANFCDYTRARYKAVSRLGKERNGTEPSWCKTTGMRLLNWKANPAQLARILSTATKVFRMAPSATRWREWMVCWKAIVGPPSQLTEEQQQQLGDMWTWSGALRSGPTANLDLTHDRLVRGGSSAFSITRHAQVARCVGIFVQRPRRIWPAPMSAAQDAGAEESIRTLKNSPSAALALISPTSHFRQDSLCNVPGPRGLPSEVPVARAQERERSSEPSSCGPRSSIIDKTRLQTPPPTSASSNNWPALSPQGPSDQEQCLLHRTPDVWSWFKPTGIGWRCISCRPTRQSLNPPNGYGSTRKNGTHNRLFQAWTPWPPH